MNFSGPRAVPHPGGRADRYAPTLVEAMIDVAMTGLYTSIIQDGLRLQVWREPELAAIQHQLEQINFIPLLYTRIPGRAGRHPPAPLRSARVPSLRSSLASGRGAATGMWADLKLKDPNSCAPYVRAARLDLSEHVHGSPLDQMLLEALGCPQQPGLVPKAESIDHQ